MPLVGTWGLVVVGVLWGGLSLSRVRLSRVPWSGVLWSGECLVGDALVELGSSSLVLPLGDLLLARPLTGDTGGEESGEASARELGAYSGASADRGVFEAFFAALLSAAASFWRKEASLTSRSAWSGGKGGVRGAPSLSSLSPLPLLTWAVSLSATVHRNLASFPPPAAGTRYANVGSVKRNGPRPTHGAW